MKASLGAFGLAVLVSASAAAQEDAPSVERADGASESGLQFALRTGFMLPFGKSAEEGTGYSIHHRSGASMSDSFSGFLPIWIEGGYRFNPTFFLGAFFQYAFGFPKNCDFGVDCSDSDLRVGAEGHYHFLPGRMADPWLGLGIGYEWLKLSESTGALTFDRVFHGFEFVDFQAGIDLVVTESFSVGPFAALTLAQYRTASARGTGIPVGGSSGGWSSSGPIDRRALHELLIFGVRGTFSL